MVQTDCTDYWIAKKFNIEFRQIFCCFFCLNLALGQKNWEFDCLAEYCLFTTGDTIVRIKTATAKKIAVDFDANFPHSRKFRQHDVGAENSEVNCPIFRPIPSH